MAAKITRLGMFETNFVLDNSSFFPNDLISSLKVCVYYLQEKKRKFQLQNSYVYAMLKGRSRWELCRYFDSKNKRHTFLFIINVKFPVILLKFNDCQELWNFILLLFIVYFRLIFIYHLLSYTCYKSSIYYIHNAHYWLKYSVVD